MTNRTAVNARSAQQLFDCALNGMRQQNYQQSVKKRTPTGCVYYAGTADNGARLSCAVGHMLTVNEAQQLDRQYGFKASSISSILGDVDCPAFMEQFREHKHLLCNLQQCHDAFHGQEQVEERMQGIATAYQLNYTAPATNEVI